MESRKREPDRAGRDPVADGGQPDDRVLVARAQAKLGALERRNGT